MATIHPEPKLVFVFPDGEGAHYLRVVAADDTVQVMPLTLDRALRLSADLTAAARDMAKAMQKRPL